LLAIQQRGGGWGHPQANTAWKMPSTISNTFRTVNLLSVVEMLTKNNPLQKNLKNKEEEQGMASHKAKGRKHNIVTRNIL
jgi:hypothetical protein